MKNLISLLLTGALAIGALSEKGCTPAISQEKYDSTVAKIENGEDLLIGIEGVWSIFTIYAVENATREIANTSDMAQVATSGYDEKYIDLIKKANQKKEDVYIVAHSAGSEVAARIARDCYERDRSLIIKRIFFLDAFTSDEITPNVERVTDIHSEEPYALGKQTHAGAEFIQIRDSNHFNLPERAESDIESIIRQDQARR